jgi:hypothetical protein
VLALDRWAVDRPRIVPRGESSRPFATRHRPGSPVRLPTGLRGILQLGWSGPDDAAICHRCDFAGCTNPAHMRLGTNATDRAEYLARNSDPAGPLADVRGAAGSTRAIAAAIRAGLNECEDAPSIEKRIRAAEIAGLPPTLR